jgi:hypothetical protein
VVIVVWGARTLPVDPDAADAWPLFDAIVERLRERG